MKKQPVKPAPKKKKKLTKAQMAQKALGTGAAGKARDAIKKRKAQRQKMLKEMG